MAPFVQMIEEMQFVYVSAKHLDINESMHCFLNLDNLCCKA